MQLLAVLLLLLCSLCRPAFLTKSSVKICCILALPLELFIVIFIHWTSFIDIPNSLVASNRGSLSRLSQACLKSNKQLHLYISCLYYIVDMFTFYHELVVNEWYSRRFAIAILRLFFRKPMIYGI